MLVTMDTNVLVQAVASSNGASARILDAVLAGELNLALSVAVFNEYEDVLRRPELQQTLKWQPQDIEVVLSAVLFVARRQSVYFRWRPNLSDEKDNLFVELAIASGSEYLITSNRRDFIRADLKSESFVLVNPAEFLRIWRSAV